MNEQSWTLVGIVIGALLGAGAQFFADFLRAKRERKIRDEELRRDAYRSMLSACRRVLISMDVADNVYERLASRRRSKGRKDELLIDLTNRVAADAAVLRDAISRMDVDASADVFLPSRTAYKLCIELARPLAMGDRPTVAQVDRAPYDEAFRALREAIRKEMGRGPLPDTE